MSAKRTPQAGPVGAGSFREEEEDDGSNTGDFGNFRDFVPSLSLSLPSPRQIVLIGFMAIVVWELAKPLKQQQQQQPE